MKLPITNDESDDKNDKDGNDVDFIEAFRENRDSEPPFSGGDADCGAEVGGEASSNGGI